MRDLIIRKMKEEEEDIIDSLKELRNCSKCKEVDWIRVKDGLCQECLKKERNKNNDILKV